MSISRSWQAYWSECLPVGRPRGPAIGIAVAVDLLCGLLNTVYAISFIVRSGLLSVLVDGPADDRVRLRTAGPCTLVGEIAFILEQPRTAWVVAETAATADRITRNGLARMAAEQPQLLVAMQTAMLRILARRVADSTELVVQLSR